MTTPYLHTGQTKLMLQVVKDLARDEGFREYAYPDPLSKLARTHKSKDWGFKPAREIMRPGEKVEDGAPWTYGFGFTAGVNVDSKISRIQAERKLEELILEEDCKLHNALYWYDESSFVTKTVLINMAFNLGLRGLLGFRNTLAYVKAKDYSKAARNMRLSLWYSQVGSRAKYLAQRMEKQVIEPHHLAQESIR